MTPPREGGGRLARAQCPYCCRVLAVQVPRGGDGSAEVYPRHDHLGRMARCDGSREIVRDEDYVEGVR